MILGGLQKLTLIDYPGKVAATVFTSGCNFGCAYCHNYDLMGDALAKVRRLVSEKEFFKFLDSRVGLLEGVCVSGGEPTVQPDLPRFIKQIKEKGFSVKLDTNGTNPEMLEYFLKKKLVDYVAMDIKSSPAKYEQVARPKNNFVFDLKQIEKSIILVKKFPDYEFRTTVANGLHTQDDLFEIIDWISGSKNYFLQQYRPVNFSFAALERPLGKFPERDLVMVLNRAQAQFKNCALRE